MLWNPLPIPITFTHWLDSHYAPGHHHKTNEAWEHKIIVSPGGKLCTCELAAHRDAIIDALHLLGMIDL